jgi:ubiquinone/menaquinone biosynthesis C-methylase UbiE
MHDKENSLNEEIWSKMSNDWAVGVPPWRPSKGEINIYEDYVQKILHKCNGKCKALIMGSTPELRDMLAKYEIDVTLVDINPNMARAMTELLEYSDGKEKIVNANWLNMPIKESQFDIILCDQGLHHIFFEDWEKQLTEVSRLLKNEGYFLNGIVTVEEKEKITAAKIVNILKNTTFSLEDSFYYGYRLWCSIPDVEERKFYKDCEVIIQEYERLYGEEKIDKKEMEMLIIPFFIKGLKVVMPIKSAVDQMLGKYFTIKSVRVNFEHPAFTCHKIYFGKKK